MKRQDPVIEGNAGMRKRTDRDPEPPARLVGAQVIDLSHDDMEQTTLAQRERRRTGGRPRKWNDPQALYIAGMEYFDERDAALDPILLPSGKVIVKRGRPYTVAGLASALGMSLPQLLVYERDPIYTEQVRVLKTIVLENSTERSYGMFSAGPIHQSKALGFTEARPDEIDDSKKLNIIEIHLPAKREPDKIPHTTAPEIADGDVREDRQVDKLSEAPLTIKELGTTPLVTGFGTIGKLYTNGKHHP
jgi:hypothetical protein